MRLYYTGSNQADQPSNATKSLGGYISNTTVLNGSVANLFPEITRGAIRDAKKEVRCIALYNESVADLTNILLYTTTPEGSLFEYKIGVIAPALDPVCSKYYFELLSTPNQLPLSPELLLHETSGDAISIDSILAGAYVGLWISREYKQTTIDMFVDTEECSDESLANLALIEELKNAQTNIDIVIEY